MCAHEVPMGDARTSADRGAIAVVHVDIPRDSALGGEATRVARQPTVHFRTSGNGDN